MLQVKAKGHAPELKPVVAKGGSGPVAIRLGPAHTLTGRVVDSQGKPIAGAFVGVDTWRTYRRWAYSSRPTPTGGFGGRMPRRTRS